MILAQASNERSKKKISPVLAPSKHHGRKGKKVRDDSHESEVAPSIQRRLQNKSFSPMFLRKHPGGKGSRRKPDELSMQQE